MITIAIGSDHHGFEHKSVLQAGVTLETRRIEWIDVGCFSAERTDYPTYARDVALQIQSGKAALGILLCGTGTGMAIAANRFAGIYAGVAWNEQVAMRCREEDNVNVLVIPSDYVNPSEAIKVALAWIEASFQGDRYQKRIGLIDQWGGL